jgi:hypothetical protein
MANWVAPKFTPGAEAAVGDGARNLVNTPAFCYTHLTPLRYAAVPAAATTT